MNFKQLRKKKHVGQHVVLQWKHPEILIPNCCWIWFWLLFLLTLFKTEVLSPHSSCPYFAAFASFLYILTRHLSIRFLTLPLSHLLSFLTRNFLHYLLKPPISTYFICFPNFPPFLFFFSSNGCPSAVTTSTSHLQRKTYP